MRYTIALASLLCLSCATRPNACLSGPDTDQWEPAALSPAEINLLKKQVHGRVVWEREYWFHREDGAVRLCRVSVRDKNRCRGEYIDFIPTPNGLEAPPI